MELSLIFTLIIGFYIGLLSAKCGLKFDSAVKPFTGLAKAISNLFDDKDKENSTQEENAEKEKGTDKRGKKSATKPVL